MLSRRALFRGAAATVIAGAAVGVSKLPAPTKTFGGKLANNIVQGHKTTIRMGLPNPTWRKLHEGVLPVKTVVRELNSRNEILDDIPWKEEV